MGQRKPASVATEQLRVHVRWMIRRDFPEVLEIESSSSDYPWSQDEFLTALRNRNCIGMVAEQGEKVIGFMLYELHQKSIWLLNMAVHPKFVRLGLGTQMVDRLKSKLIGHRRVRLRVKVRERNLPAQLFFKAQGFLAGSVDFGGFEDQDGYRMEYRLPS